MSLVVRTTSNCLGILISGLTDLYIVRILEPLFVYLILLLIPCNLILLSQEFIMDLHSSLLELSGRTFWHDVLFFSRGDLIGHHHLGCIIVD